MAAASTPAATSRRRRTATTTAQGRRRRVSSSSPCSARRQVFAVLLNRIPPNYIHLPTDPLWSPEPCRDHDLGQLADVCVRLSRGFGHACELCTSASTPSPSGRQTRVRSAALFSTPRHRQCPLRGAVVHAPRRRFAQPTPLMASSLTWCTLGAGCRIRSTVSQGLGYSAAKTRLGYHTARAVWGYWDTGSPTTSIDRVFMLGRNAWSGGHGLWHREMNTEVAVSNDSEWQGGRRRAIDVTPVPHCRSRITGKQRGNAGGITVQPEPWRHYDPGKHGDGADRAV